MATNTALQMNNPHLHRNRCWRHLQDKTFSFIVSWQRQIKLCVSSQKVELFKLSTLSFQPLMQKLTKKIKNMICHIWLYCKDPTVAHRYLRLHVHAWIHPWIKLSVSFNGFLSDSVEINHSVCTVCCPVSWRYQYPDSWNKTQFFRRPFQFSVNEVFRMKAEHFSSKMKVLAIWKLAKQSQKTPFCSGE